MVGSKFIKIPLGSVVILDAGFHNEVKVEVIRQSPNFMFSVVRPVGCADVTKILEVMTNRLSF